VKTPPAWNRAVGMHKNKARGAGWLRVSALSSSETDNQQNHGKSCTGILVDVIAREDPDAFPYGWLGTCT